jgi:hypothetical protein
MYKVSEGTKVVKKTDILNKKGAEVKIITILFKNYNNKDKQIYIIISPNYYY